MGPEGSGKFTQAKMLAEDLGFHYISTRDIIRGFVIDGVLRIMEGIDGFEDMLSSAGRSKNSITVISLRTAGWESAGRFIKREIKDDSFEAILNRLLNYYYKLKGRTYKIRKNENLFKFYQMN